MRHIPVALVTFLFFISSQVTAQKAESLFYYVPAVGRNLAPNVQFVEDTLNRKLKIFIVNNWQQKIDISVYCNGMRNWYRGPLRSGSMLFNFSEAVPGEYRVRVHAGERQFTYKMTVKN